MSGLGKNIKTRSMTKLLEEAVAHIQTLPEEEQNRAAEVLLIAFSKDERDYNFTDEQIAGIEHAIEQAQRGEFASDEDVREIFGSLL